MKNSTLTSVVLSLLIASAGVLQAQQPLKTTPPEVRDDWGRQRVLIPEATDRGDWTGTWFYVSRELQVAIWLNQKGDGVPEVKMRLFRLGGGEQFVTDWTGHADYKVKGAPGRFNLTLEGGDEKSLDATWDWSLDFANSSRSELAKLKMYRTGDGRRLTLRFDELTRTIRRGAVVNEVPLEQVWVLRKASKRIVDWGELPF